MTSRLHSGPNFLLPGNRLPFPPKTKRSRQSIPGKRFSCGPGASPAASRIASGECWAGKHCKARTPARPAGPSRSPARTPSPRRRRRLLHRENDRFRERPFPWWQTLALSGSREGTVRSPGSCEGALIHDPVGGVRFSVGPASRRSYPGTGPALGPPCPWTGGTPVPPDAGPTGRRSHQTASTGPRIRSASSGESSRAPSRRPRAGGRAP